MLFDPKWEVKADPLSLESLIAWLEKQLAGARYDYGCNGTCMLARYFYRVDPNFLSVGTSRVSFEDGDRFFDWELPDGWDDIAFGDAGPYTFGAALERARALQAS
jgi:hypothetical protein